MISCKRCSEPVEIVYTLVENRPERMSLVGLLRACPLMEEAIILCADCVDEISEAVAER